MVTPAPTDIQVGTVGHQGGPLNDADDDDDGRAVPNSHARGPPNYLRDGLSKDFTSGQHGAIIMESKAEGITPKSTSALSLEPMPNIDRSFAPNHIINFYDGIPFYTSNYAMTTTDPIIIYLSFMD